MFNLKKIKMKTLRWLLSVIIMGLVINLPAKGQENDSEKVYTEVDQMPEFPGGQDQLFKFIADNVTYPAEAKKEGIQGKVYISFAVGKNGEIADAKVERGVHAAIDAEALRVVEKMPAWTPGKKDGKQVKVKYTLPINFALAPKPKE
jgi:TonB family protein